MYTLFHMPSIPCGRMSCWTPVGRQEGHPGGGADTLRGGGGGGADTLRRGGGADTQTCGGGDVGGATDGWVKNKIKKSKSSSRDSAHP